MVELIDPKEFCTFWVRYHLKSGKLLEEYRNMGGLFSGTMRHQIYEEFNAHHRDGRHPIGFAFESEKESWKVSHSLRYEPSDVHVLPEVLLAGDIKKKWSTFGVEDPRIVLDSWYPMEMSMGIGVQKTPWEGLAND